MSGRRHTLDSLGAQYEKAADTMLPPIASVVRVPRETDFGIDFYCHPRFQSAKNIETVDGLCAVQVKGGSASLKFGGVDDKGRWHKEEFKWLMSLATPLYLLKVTPDFNSCSIYSLGPLWRHFTWRVGELPFEVVFTMREAQESCAWQLELERPSEIVSELGDMRRWTIDLGAPILHLSMVEIANKERNQLLASAMKKRIDLDRSNVLYFQQGIRFFQGFNSWKTNSDELGKPFVNHTWLGMPAANVKRLSRALTPGIVNLGLHLQAQKDSDAINFISVLEWFEARGHFSDDIAKGLLGNLRATRDK